MNYCAVDVCSEIAMKNELFCQVHCGFESIDFDEAHACWMQNKIHKSKTTYEYRCGIQKTNGGFCKRKGKFSKYEPKCQQLINAMARVNGSYCLGHQQKKAN